MTSGFRSFQKLISMPESIFAWSVIDMWYVKNGTDFVLHNFLSRRSRLSFGWLKKEGLFCFMYLDSYASFAECAEAHDLLSRVTKLRDDCPAFQSSCWFSSIVSLSSKFLLSFRLVNIRVSRSPQTDDALRSLRTLILRLRSLRSNRS